MQLLLLFALHQLPITTFNTSQKEATILLSMGPLTRSCRLIKASDRQESHPDVSLTCLTVLLTASARALKNTGKRGPGELSFGQKSEHPIFFFCCLPGDAYSSELIDFHKWLYREFYPAILSVSWWNSKGHGLAEGTFGYSSTAGSNCWQDQSSSVSKWSTRAQLFTGWLVKFFLLSYWRAILSRNTPSLPRIERAELRLPKNEGIKYHPLVTVISQIWSNVRVNSVT